MAEEGQHARVPRFVSFEGIDGAGKSTQARLLAEWLRGRGVDVVELREPGGTAAGERVRTLLLDAGTPLVPRAEALLFAAARAQAVAEVIEPALARGATVVADRFVDSSLVYQGLVRGLGEDVVRGLNAFATAGRMPDRTVLLEIAAERAVARRDDGAGDRFESQPAAFGDAITAGYAELAENAPERFVRIDGDADAAAVAERVREALGVA
jgi:dTMP kinase